MDVACCCGKLPRRASALLPPDLGGALPIEQAACLRGPRFALKPLQGLPVLGEFFRQELQGHAALELGVRGLVHDTHASAPELFEDMVVRNGLADHREFLQRQSPNCIR
jgi:hypothetical protein